jgi:hypothetical protein
MTSDLIERVKAALKNLDDSPWLPGLTNDLANIGWHELHRDIGLSPSEYSTARVMARDLDVPRSIVSLVQIALSGENPDWVLQIETLGEEFTFHFEKRGIKFYTVEEINGVKVSKGFMEAVNTLKCVPTLFATIAALVKSVHLIDAGDDDYDISFSEPHVPFSIFISVPHCCTLSGHLRVAEAVVHEAMHLQLTLIEKVVPLVATTRNKYFSPWRGEYRTAQGVMHALYVFRVIDEFLGRIPAMSYSAEEGEYLKSRRAEINTQIQELQSFQNCPELTKEGAHFVRRLVLN